MQRKSLWLPQRSLVVLNGEARFAWTHGIASRKLDKVNKTFMLSRTFPMMVEMIGVVKACSVMAICGDGRWMESWSRVEGGSR